jgi:hypothetical protein
LQTNLYATEKKYEKDEKGILSLMYHRFEENKYPSTNIKMAVFKKHMEIIKKNNFEFFDPKDFEQEFYNVKINKKILITIDDAFLSFYKNAWPFLKENQIPFILFTSTETIGNKGYMTIDQLKEVESYSFAYLGNHSHSHEYMVEFDFEKYTKDIDKSIDIFKAQFNKDPYELPRFPINEKYGDLKRFEFLINLLPLQYNKLFPKDKLVVNNNPPEMTIEFFKEQKNLGQINCFSDEGGSWDNTNINLIENQLKIYFKEKFNFRRGRINCSLNDIDGWRWLGSQFSVNLN